MGLTRQVQASNAIVNVDGADIQSESNTATGLLPGATVVLKQSGTAASTATTDPKAVDKTEATNRMRAFVDAYNAVFDQVNSLVTEATVPNATTTADQMKGLLFNSSTLTTVKDSLQNAMIAMVQGLPIGKALASDAGLSTGAVASTGFNSDSLTGKLTFDSARFGALFDSDRDALKNLVGANGGTTATDGLAQRISDLADQFTSTGGMIAAAIQGSTGEMRDLDQRIQDMNDRIQVKEAMLKAQFTAMEQAISQLKSAGDSLTSVLAQNSGN
jgi:flagellar hook-associated protein 2